MQKTALIILDGWGLGTEGPENAILKAHTPVMDALLSKYPHSKLLTHAEHVGLPDGQMGNSEVGHLNLGAGRIVYQDLVRINKSIDDGTLAKNEVIRNAFQTAKQPGKKLHFMGLVSTGGVHSHQKHLSALCQMAAESGISNSYIHVFTDGRDRDPNSGLQHIKDLEQEIAGTGARIASLTGRYFAMDRDKRWDRISRAWKLLVQGKGLSGNSAVEIIEESYANNITDEFIEPHFIANSNGVAMATFQPGDVVICFNFRTDRCREITEVLTQRDMPDEGMHTIPLHYVTMARYDDTFKNVHVIFEKDNLQHTLGEILSQNGRTQLRMAETEKYPHVTFFFSGGREQEFHGEKRAMIQSPKVSTYDVKPEMSAYHVAEEAVKQLHSFQPDFLCLNFANADMVGHTGVFDAIVRAVEATDTCLGSVLNACIELGYKTLVIADHGNAEFAVNDDGSPNTAHTMNPVPCILVDDSGDKLRLKDGVLADIAPTILFLMGIQKPDVMTGNCLIEP